MRIKIFQGVHLDPLNKIIKWCIYIFVGLLPLWFLPITSNVLDFNKQFLMIGLLTIALVAWLVKLLTQEKIRWHKGLVVVLFLAFVIIYGLATIFSLRPYDSLMGLDNDLSRSLINLIYFFIFFLLLVNSKISKLLTIFLASSAIVGIIGLFQILDIFIFPWNFTKAASFNTVGTITSLGIFLAILLPLVFGLLPRAKKWFKGFLVALFILSLVIILLLNLRTLWIITAIAMAIIIGFWLAKREVLSDKNLVWLTIPVIILAFCLIFLIFKPGPFLNLNLPIELGLSYQGGWDVVKEVIQHSPILGSGPETFVYNYSLYKPESINQTIFWNIRFNNAPAEILSLLSEIGILGLIAFLGLITIFLLKVFKNLASREIGLFSSWLTLMISWFFYPQNITLMFVFWLFFAFLVIASRDEKKDIKIVNLRASGKTALVASLGFIILIIMVIGFLYLGGSRFIAEAKYKSGLELINKGSLDSGIDKVVQATSINPYQDKFYKNLAQLFLVQINQNLNDPELTQQERENRIQMGINNAISSAVKATTLNPKNASNWIIQGSVCRNLIALRDWAGTWAIESYKKALTFEPTNPFIYTEIALTHITQADFLRGQEGQEEQIADYLNKAIEAYNEAIKLKSNYSLAHFEIALVYYRQGKTAQAITEFARAVALDSNFSNARYFLGLLYDGEGNKTAAIEQFEKIAELNPDNELVKQILANLKAGKPALESPELGPLEQSPIEE